MLLRASDLGIAISYHHNVSCLHKCWTLYELERQLVCPAEKLKVKPGQLFNLTDLFLTDLI